MPRAELGTKRTDPENGRKFYDFGKDPIVSPYTGTSYPLSFFEEPARAPSKYSSNAPKPVHREEDQEEAEDDQDEESDTVSLTDVEDDETVDAKPGVDVDDDEDEIDDKDADVVLALDEDEDDVNDLVGEREEDEG